MTVADDVEAAFGGTEGRWATRPKRHRCSAGCGAWQVVVANDVTVAV
jgi:hypothetical protein